MQNVLSVSRDGCIRYFSKPLREITRKQPVLQSERVISFQQFVLHAISDKSFLLSLAFLTLNQSSFTFSI